MMMCGCVQTRLNGEGTPSSPARLRQATKRGRASTTWVGWGGVGWVRSSRLGGEQVAVTRLPRGGGARHGTAVGRPSFRAGRRGRSNGRAGWGAPAARALLPRAREAARERTHATFVGPFARNARPARVPPPFRCRVAVGGAHAEDAAPSRQPGRRPCSLPDQDQEQLAQCPMFGRGREKTSLRESCVHEVLNEAYL
jgi:hypothetical protein